MSSATSALGLDRMMPVPPVRTSDALFPGWQDLRICLYRLPPARIDLPADEALRVVIQLSSSRLRLERNLRGMIDVAEPGLDAININPAHQPIGWRWDSFIEFLQICISPRLLERMEVKDGLQSARLAMLEQFNVHDAMLAQVGHELADMLEGRCPAADGRDLDTMARLLVTHLWNHYCAGHDGDAVQRGQTFRHIVDFIHDNLDRELPLEQIARMANLSNFHFIRLFKAAVGTTPHRYILRCRLNLARQLLRETCLPIGDISRRCGFTTQSHFTSAFRQAVGLSPRVYRQASAPAERSSH